MKSCNDYFTAKELRTDFELNVREDIPDTDKFILCTGNPAIENKVATINQWMKHSQHGRGIGWIL